MALQKTIETPMGIAATYHNIGDVTWDKGSPNRVPVRVDSYLDSAARQSGAKPLISDRINLEDDLSSGSVDLSFTTLYAKLKLLPLFEDSEDV